MFSLGFSEILLIALVALVVLGPERLPAVAKTAGHLYGKARRLIDDLKDDIEKETELSELKKLKDETLSIVSDVQKEVESVATTTSEALSELEHLDSSVATVDTTPDTEDLALEEDECVEATQYGETPFDDTVTLEKLNREIERLKREVKGKRRLTPGERKAYLAHANVSRVTVRR